MEIDEEPTGAATIKPIGEEFEDGEDEADNEDLDDVDSNDILSNGPMEDIKAQIRKLAYRHPHIDFSQVPKVLAQLEGKTEEELKVLLENAQHQLQSTIHPNLIKSMTSTVAKLLPLGEDGEDFLEELNEDKLLQASLSHTLSDNLKYLSPFLLSLGLIGGHVLNYAFGTRRPSKRVKPAPVETPSTDAAVGTQ